MIAMLNQEQWVSFLKKYAAAAGGDSWPGSPPASEEQLLAAEKRLKVQFPPSYRAFLSASNGWRYSSQTAPVLRSVQNIKWFRKEHKDWYEAYQMGAEPINTIEQEYFNYVTVDNVEFDIKHLAQALCISEIGDQTVVLLNPMAVWPDGEWEVWFFANWLPGAVRYRSFDDWMRHELAGLLNQPFEHSLKPGELPTVYLDGPGKEERRIRPREEVLVLENVLETLKSKKKSDRVKAAQQLGRLGGQQAVRALLDALKKDPEKEVRWRAADSLGYLTPPEAVEGLIAAFDDPLVNSTAIHALGGFSDEPSAQFLLRILEGNGLYAITAAGALAKRGDIRSIKHLLYFLMSAESKDRHNGEIAGRIIANFQEPGFTALEPLMSHADLKIRERAYRGISDLASLAKDKSVRRKAYELLQKRFEIEMDPRLREWIGISIEISAKKNSN